MPPTNPVIEQVLEEQHQGQTTRKRLFVELEAELGRPVVSFFTSLNYPVNIEDVDADMLEGVLQKIDLSQGLALFISSLGGFGEAAERIITVCRAASDTGEFGRLYQARRNLPRRWFVLAHQRY
jgi:hypothetical protein